MAKLDIEGLAFVELKFEDVVKPPTENFVDRVFVHEGFGMAVPQLEMYLNDASFNLVRNLGIHDGSKITLKHGRTTDNLQERKFRVFGFKTVSSASGPRLKVLAILDVPMYTAHILRKSYTGSTSSVMGEVASAVGLQYEGPGGTSDNQKWLQVNITPNAFTEFLAVHGYSDPKSCMYRVVTSTKKLRYKNLMQELAGTPGEDKTFYLNPDVPKPLTVRELQDFSVSGVTNTFVGYKYRQVKHTLDSNLGEGQSHLDKLLEHREPQQHGFALPVNQELKAQIESRMDYYGFDVGTNPKPASNLHEFYVEAVQQNVTGLSMFSQRVRVLVDLESLIEPLDLVAVKHREQIGDGFARIVRTEGKYLVGGKTMAFVNGHHYYEVHDLYRPFINNPKETSTSTPVPSAPSNQAGGQNAFAPISGVGASSGTPVFNPSASSYNSSRSTGAAGSPTSIGRVKSFSSALSSKVNERGNSNRMSSMRGQSAADHISSNSSGGASSTDAELRNSLEALSSDKNMGQFVSETKVDSSKGFTVNKLNTDLLNDLQKNGEVNAALPDLSIVSDSPRAATDNAVSSIVPAGSIESEQVVGDDLGGNLDLGVFETLVEKPVSRALEAIKNGERFAEDLSSIPVAELAKLKGNEDLASLGGVVGDYMPTEDELRSMLESKFKEDVGPAVLQQFGSMNILASNDKKSFFDSDNLVESEGTGSAPAIDLSSTISGIKHKLETTDPTDVLINEGAEAYADMFGNQPPDQASYDVGKVLRELDRLYREIKDNAHLADTKGMVQRILRGQSGITVLDSMVSSVTRAGVVDLVLSAYERGDWESLGNKTTIKELLEAANE